MNSSDIFLRTEQYMFNKYYNHKFLQFFNLIEIVLEEKLLNNSDKRTRRWSNICYDYEVVYRCK